MDIRIADVGIEAARGFEAAVVHSNGEWSLDNSIPMVEEGGEWVLKDAESVLKPDEPFKVVIKGFADYGEAERAYYARGAANVLASPRKMFWDPASKLFFLLAPGYVTFETPGRKWNNRFSPLT